MNNKQAQIRYAYTDDWRKSVKCPRCGKSAVRFEGTATYRHIKWETNPNGFRIRKTTYCK